MKMNNQEDIFYGHKIRCEERQKIIVSEEKQSKHIAKNTDNHLVRKYKIDGDVIKSHDVDKCDYLVLNDEKKTAYFIELKGSKMHHAIAQLKSSANVCRSSLRGYTFYYRVVFSGSATHSINDSIFLRWQRKCGKIKGIFVVQRGRIKFEEEI
jgi:hypothetical protein